VIVPVRANDAPQVGEGHALPSCESLLFSAVWFLESGGEDGPARVLRRCTLQFAVTDAFPERTCLHVNLVGPRAVYEILDDQQHAIHRAARRAFEAVLPKGYQVSWLSAQAELIEPPVGWRTERALAGREGAHNQGLHTLRPQMWKGLRFGSQSEIRIAEALERADVAFSPNCVVRLGEPGKRRNLEVDFLIRWRDRLGVLEVDGGPFHHPERAAQEHDRDRLFRAHGIRVERYSAERCSASPDEVVAEFLGLLEKP
jgi:hypothetical protein